MDKKKFMMIVTEEDERYTAGEVQLTHYANAPWDGRLTAVVSGDNAEELYAKGDFEGLFYQLYVTESGQRIGYGVIDPDSVASDVMEYNIMQAKRSVSTASTLFDSIIAAIPNTPADIWAGSSDEILCKNNIVASCLADLFDAVAGTKVVTTGYYDPEEDKRNDETDSHTGFWYVNWF